jgi:hypothetical protein
MQAAEELATSVGKAAACRALGVARASFYRYCQPKPELAAVSAKSKQTRALSGSERQEVLDTLHCERFVDQPPREVYAILGSTKDSMKDSTSVVSAPCIASYQNRVRYANGAISSFITNRSC